MFHPSLLKISLIFSILLGMPLALAREADTKKSLPFEWMLVDDASNTFNASGTVSEIFFSSEHPVTVHEWACFMNAVYVDPENKNDVRDLYHPEMFDDKNPSSSLQVSMAKAANKSASEPKWIYSARSVRSGFFWTTVTNNGSSPITNITFDDAKRYCNWCEHGAPHATSFEEALAITENGVYDFTDQKEGELVKGTCCIRDDRMQSDVDTHFIDSSNQNKTEVLSDSALEKQAVSASKAVAPASSQNSFWSFMKSLWNVACSQIGTNLIEIAMNGFSLAQPPDLTFWGEGETLFSWISNKLCPWAWEYRVQTLKSFTYPRIAMNCFFSLITAAGISTEVTPYLQDDSWQSICWTIAKTIAVMTMVESGAFILEYPTALLWYYFGAEAEATIAAAFTKAIATVADGLTWNRLLLNVVYIGLNTYLSVTSTVQDYEKQHPSS